MIWLLESSIREVLERAQKNGSAPSAQQLDYEARIGGDSDESGSRILTVVGNNAEINIEGVLTERPNFMAFLFGGGNTTYPDINAAIASAEQNPEIDNIKLAIDSPGGSIAGLFKTLDTIKAAKKPITAVVTNVAASAAYAIAANADKIVAANRSTMFGSIGIKVDAIVNDNMVSIASTKAPKKSPDLATKEGQAVIREELDPVHDLFAEEIAAGRNVSVDTVNAEFGQGSVLLAGEALKRGMIDSVADSRLSIVGSTDSTTTAHKDGNNSEIGPMDLNTLKASHHDVYAAAVQEGIKQERDRVGAHLTMGAGSGDMKTALASVADGSEMTATLQAAYLTAGMNRKDIEQHQIDADLANGGDKATQSKDAEKAKADKAANDILALAAANCGVELEA